MNTLRVMIVDDETIFRMGLLYLYDWNSVGIEIVAQAANGMEALELMDKVQPDVVITDVMMPIMDGIELVKKLRQSYPSVKIIILSSFSEYEYVREVFKYGVDDYLLKPKVTADELISLIHPSDDIKIEQKFSFVPVLKEPSIILSQWFEHEMDLNTTDVEQLKARLNCKGFSILITDISVLQALTNTSQYELEKFILEQCYSLLNNLPFTVAFTKQHITIVIGEHEDEGALLNRNGLIIQLVRFINNKYGDLKFILSNPIERLAQIKLKYLELQQLLQRSIYFNDRNSIFESEFKAVNKEIPFDHESFVNTIKFLTFNHGLEMIHEYLYEVSKHQAYDAYSLKRFIQHLIYTVLSATEHLDLPISTSSIEKLKWFKKIDLCVTVEQLEDIVTQFFKIIEQQFIEHSNTETNILNQLIEYVNQHYAEDISLSDLADKFHMNYSYLSCYFKQHTGENLTSYINRIRIDKAKDLLKYSDQSISQISAKIGFSEHNYFSKVFKKFTGMTPIEYRNSLTETR